MNKKQICEINLSDEEFKKLKRNKQSILLRLNNDDENKKITEKEKVILINSKNKRLKRKVKSVKSYSNIKEVFDDNKKKKLGYKRKEEFNFDDIENTFSETDLKKYGILAIELKIKNHIFRRILLGILTFIILAVILLLIRNGITKINNTMFSNAINKIDEEKVSYMFVEINPSFAITIKNNKVNDVACLNDDCVSIYDDIKIVDKNINDSIEYLFNLAKEKGFDTSNGVKIRTSDKLDIDTNKLSYVNIEYIDETTKSELLSSIKNNKKIKNINNDDYYSKLWERLKKDSDYDKVYTCKMNNAELECYFIMENITADPETTNFATYEKRLNDIANTFDKFNIRHNYDFTNILVNGDIWNVYIGNQKFDLSDSIEYSLILEKTEIGKKERMVLIVSGDESDYQHFIPMKYLNLINPTSSLNKITSLESYANSIEKQYGI